MQGSCRQMLRDPVTQAPLDENALLGVEDGYTYGMMSIAVTRAALPESQRDLSPMTGQPLTLVPHPLARFMVQWLGKRGDALYSADSSAPICSFCPKKERSL